MDDLSTRWHRSVDRAARMGDPVSRTWRWLLGTGSPSAGDKAKIELQNKALQEAARARDEAIKAVEAATRDVGRTELAAGVQAGFKRSPMKGEDLLSRLLKQAFGTDKPQPHEAAGVTEQRQRAKGQLAQMVQLAMEGVPEELNQLMKKLTARDVRGQEQIQGGTKLAEEILNAVLPLQEERWRTLARGHFTRFARIFASVTQEANATLPKLTAQGRQQIGHKLQGQLDEAGVAPDMQATIAKLFQGKKGGQRAAALNVIVPMLMQAGATQREVYEALPRIFADMDQGANVFQATQRALHDLTRGGLVAGLQGANQNPFRQQVRSGLGILGLTPEVEPGQTSRFRPRRRPDGRQRSRESPAEIQARRRGEAAAPAAGWGVRRPWSEAAEALDAQQADRAAQARAMIEANDQRTAERRRRLPGVAPATPPPPRPSSPRRPARPPGGPATAIVPILRACRPRCAR